jgi:hypothetical protein
MSPRVTKFGGQLFSANIFKSASIERAIQHKAGYAMALGRNRYTLAPGACLILLFIVSIAHVFIVPG